MSRILEINGKEYKLEFTIEASLYKDCTEKVAGFMSNVASAEDEEDKKKDNKSKIKELISTMSDIPQTTLTMFYAGLLEHHGEDGDQTVMSLHDAKKLIKQYFKEHENDETGNFYGVMQILLEQMAEDGFFKQIGLEQIAEQTTQEVKTPQYHKRKLTKQ